MKNTALHRALLSRRFPQLPINDNQPVVSGKFSGNAPAEWTIAFIVGTGRWRLEVQTASSKQRSEAHRLDGLVQELSFAEAELQHDAEIASLNERRRQEEDAYTEWLAAIPGLSDADLDHEIRSAEDDAEHHGDCINRWGWDPAMTGPDNPGINHFQAMLDESERTLDALVAEKSRRNRG